MQDVLWQMALMIALGVGWRLVAPFGLEADPTRRALTGLVYTILLPALVLLVVWRAPLGLDTLRTALSAAGGVLFGLAVGWGAYRAVRAAPPAAGALILAAAFPNATYLGLPVLEKTFGPWARGVAIQYDLFACTPLLLTVGVLVARTHGTDPDGENPVLALLKVPPLWAAAAAMALNLAGITLPHGVEGFLSGLGATVPPLMLIALGLGLVWDRAFLARMALIVPAVVIQLLLVPAVVWALAAGLGLSGERLVAVVLEGAMPCMVLGVVLCDRFGLDGALYAGAVTISTVLSLATLPLWFAWVA
jgi:malate permease and related proteins